ncbi:MAG: 4-hydroxyphenylacetate 3-hydroxylase N-terminal domain-containing protein [Steroidobacteraceae bacterium]
MIRTGQQYLDSIRDSREVFINGERVKNVTQNPMMKPLIDRKAANLSARVMQKPR